MQWEAHAPPSQGKDPGMPATLFISQSEWLLQFMDSADGA